MEEHFFRGIRPYVAVDQDGHEHVFEDIPVRNYFDDGEGYWDMEQIGYKVRLPKGSIKKLIGRELNFEDEAVELREE